MCRSAEQRREAQFGSVQVHFSFWPWLSGLRYGSVQTTRDQHHSNPAQAQPSPGTAEKMGDEGRGTREG